jgi:ubiquitin-protein ligase
MYVQLTPHLMLHTLTSGVGTMMTRIFHPNVSKAGEICVDTLKKSWNKKYGVGHVLVVRSLLRE